MNGRAAIPPNPGQTVEAQSSAARSRLRLAAESVPAAGRCARAIERVKSCACRVFSAAAGDQEKVNSTQRVIKVLLILSCLSLFGKSTVP
jgi:hypothetical protein